MQKINFIDRTPGNVAGNGAIRYGIYNSDGSLRGYAYITKEDEATITGTKINKILFDKIDANLENINGKAEIANKSWTLSSELGSKVRTEDIIPKTWTRTSSSSEDYTNGDMTIKGETEPSGSSERTLDRMFDGNIESRYYPEESTTNAYAVAYIDFGKKYQITKLRIKAGGAKLELVTSDDPSALASQWDVRYQYPLDEDYSHPVTDDIIELTGSYQCYGLRYRKDNLGTRWLLGYEFQVAEWIEPCYITEFDFNIGEIEEGTTMIIKTSATGYRNLLRFNDKDIFITNILDANKYFELIYNGETFDATEIA